MAFRFNLRYFLFFSAILFIEIIIALYIHDTFIRPFIGDLLVIILMYLFLRIFSGAKKIPLVSSILLFSFIVEISQYYNLITFLGLENNHLARVVMGATFDKMDFLAYSTGALIIMVPELIFKMR